MDDLSFYFIRHGQSVANHAGRFAGHLDTPLTDEGRAQARSAAGSAGDWLRPVPDIIYTSTLERAQETAAIINDALGLPVAIDAALCEQHYGSLQGQEKAPVVAAHGEEWYLSPPGGEAFMDFRTRVCGAIERILEAHRQPLIVAHGGLVTALAWRESLGKQTRWGVPNASWLRAVARPGGGWDFFGLDGACLTP